MKMPAPTKEQIKAIYMASKHLEWTPFAQSMGWDAVRSRQEYPSQTWIQEKKTILALQQSEQIAEMVWDHRGQWHRDVLNTLKDLPQANDAMLGILKHRMNEMIQTINEDAQNKVLHARSGSPDPFRSEFSKIKTNELVALSTAISIVTQSKHRSLLIDQWNVKTAETFTDPAQFEREDQKLADNDWTIEVIGNQKMDNVDIERLMHKYYDQKPPRDLLAEAKLLVPGERTAVPPTAYPKPEEET